MICPRCGNFCDDSARVCPSCGADFTNGQRQQPNYQQQNYQQPNYQQQNYQQPNYQQPNYQQQNYCQQPNYQQPGYQYPPNAGMGGNYRAPVKKRSVAVCILLTIITCGIYGIYWFICMVNDLNVASERIGDASGGTVFLLSLITCGIYGMYWLYKAGEKVSYIKMRNTGVPSSSNGILYLILGLVGLPIVSYCLIQSELNEVATLQ